MNNTNNEHRICIKCSGAGMYACPVCGGKGVVSTRVYDRAYQDMRDAMAMCRACQGVGTVMCSCVR